MAPEIHDTQFALPRQTAVDHNDVPVADRNDALRDHIRDAMDRLAVGAGEWDKFSVTYDDQHPLFSGGQTLTIRGDGKVTQVGIRRMGRSGLWKTKDVSASELRRLVELIRKHRAWEQMELRPMPPDTGMASLRISYGDETIEMWEWSNELERNMRMLEILEAMEQAAWIADPVDRE